MFCDPHHHNNGLFSMIVWWWPWQQYIAVGKSGYIRRDIPLVLPTNSDVIIWSITSMCDITKIIKIWLRHHSSCRICANSKYVLKFDLGLGCIKYTDNKNAKAKSGFDGWDGLAIYMQMSIIETHHIYTVHSTRVAQPASTHPRRGEEQQNLWQEIGWG